MSDQIEEPKDRLNPWLVAGVGCMFVVIAIASVLWLGLSWFIHWRNNR